MNCLSFHAGMSGHARRNEDWELESSCTLNRILIVEDEILISMDLACFLENNGYEIVGLATDGENAVKMATETHPDLIIMDIDLQGSIDGIRAAGMIQKKYLPKIIFASGRSENDPRIQKLLKENISRFIHKPYFNDVVYEKIMEMESLN